MTRRENKSKTMARYSHPSAVGIAVMWSRRQARSLSALFSPPLPKRHVRLSTHAAFQKAASPCQGECAFRAPLSSGTVFLPPFAMRTALPSPTTTRTPFS